MPESLFVRRPFRKSRLVVAVIGAVLLHGSLVAIAALHPFTKSWVIPDPVTDLDTGPVVGEPVQELVLPKDEPVPTPEPQETPPPDTPPPDTPPPTEDPDMDIATPHPDTPKPNPKPFKPSGTPFPANAKHGDHPQMGVVGGVPHADKTTGTPGAAKLGISHVPLSKPPYPYQARAAHITGSGMARASFDGSGHCSSVTITQSAGSAILDSNTVSFGRANWVGTPNTSVMVPITYRLQ